MDGQRPSAGWFPDPFGRFDLRYFNGTTWTGDVSAAGQRYVDPAGATGPVPPATASARPGGRRNGAAVAALVLGIIAASTAWMPFLVVIGVLCAVVAIPLAVVGRRAARSGARGASMATSALVLGILALPLAVLGAVLTAVVLDMVQPGAHTVTGEECRSSAGRATFSGSVTNLTDEEQSYTVFVQFTRAGTSSIIGDDTVSVDDVAPGATGPFVASIGTDVDDVDCEVIDVLGGLPFSID